MTTLAVLVGCQGSLGTGDTLLGKWKNPDARLVASDKGVDYTARCMHATFGPVVIDGNNHFTAQSTSLELGGNIIPTPGETLEIRGQFVEGGLSLQLFFHVPGHPVNDPIGITLTPGGSSDVLVCNA
jgi:hypothetical protein